MAKTINGLIRAAEAASADAWERTRAGERTGAAEAHHAAAWAHQHAAGACAILGDAREYTHRAACRAHFAAVR